MDLKKSILYAALLTGQLVNATPPRGAVLPWMELDTPQTFCERRVSLDVSADYFFEIANDLPGHDEYNALIVLYHKKYWAELDRSISVFVKTFERSPLREAVAFLEAQSKFQRVDPADEAAVRGAEKAMREALLLYPKSKLAPVICATSANFWLKRGGSERAMSMYRSSLATYGDGPLACVFKMGIGETSFQLQDWPAADTALQDVLQTCHNFPLRASAQIRVVEAPMMQGKAGAEGALEKLLEVDGGYVERFHQSAFFNLGELKYRAAKYNDAKFYFQQYLRNERKPAPCGPQAQSRIGDIAFRSNEPLPKVAGKYFEVHEASANTDFGRFAYAHALLLTLDDVKRPELDRRVRIVDEMEAAIVDAKLKERLFLEKSLASLQWGEPGALNYLVHFRQRTKAFSPVVAAFVRAKVRVLSEAALSPTVGEDAEALGTFEQRYADWIRGTPDEAWAKKLYAQTMTARAETALRKSDRTAAVSTLDRWRTSALWEGAGPAEELKKKIVIAILQEVTTPESEKFHPREAALFYLGKAELLKPFFTGDLAMIPAVIAYVAGDDKPLQPYITGKLALPKKMFVPIAGTVSLILGQAQHKAKEFIAAERTLAAIGEAALQPAKYAEIMATLRDAGKYDGAYTSAVRRLDLAKTADRSAILVEMSQLARDGKLWNRAFDLLHLAEKNALKGKALAPYQYLAGRSAYEKLQCNTSIKAYEKGIELDPDAPEIPEARYRLGKCLARSRRMVAARLEYDKVVATQDSFWSPLARNELKILAQ